VQAVNELIQKWQRTIEELRRQLQKARDKMKKFADGKRSEKNFEIGDWVFLKFHQYRQVSVLGSKYS
jgi:Skp family chaperone for outer membrane proteins